MRILLTNDDSHASPLFKIAIEQLERIGELRIVVPNEEQSWKGKSMTRFDPVYVDEILLHGRRAYGVSGTPADCISLGIHNLYDEPPDLVVSGINIGINTGLSFMLASGTVGACLEANIAGVPAVALSQHLNHEVFQTWDRHRRFDLATINALATDIERVLPGLFDWLGERLTLPVTWNVNFPIDMSGAEFRLAALGETRYRRVFAREGDRYWHRLQTFDVDNRPTSDFQVVRAGHVAVTRIDIRRLAGAQPGATGPAAADDGVPRG